jgi:sialate O-acetylesterase
MTLARRRLLPFLCVVSLLLSAAAAVAEVKLPAIFSDHMVLQQNQKDRVWGWAEPGESISVSIAGQKQTVRAGDDGAWAVQLDAMSAGGPYTLTVSGKNVVKFEDVLIGEVWVCSGQSNMELPVAAANDGDIEGRAARFSRIRLVRVPKNGTQELQRDFKGEWRVCAPENVGQFSAVGYFFGRQIHQTLDVPVGLIDNSWGGSACEAWVRRDLLAADSRYAALMDRWTETEKTFNFDKAMAEYKAKLAAWEKTAAENPQGQAVPQRPQPPGNPLTGNARPANIYNGMVKPILGYGIRGAIWYQGESNAPRAYQYRHLFPLMIKSWRDEWGVGDFPFYWVQLADFKEEMAEPGDSDWAELREAQTMTMRALPNTGEAVIIDLGEAQDIHPRNKQDVGKRLARWALASDYGIDVVHHSPGFKSMEKQGSKVILTFENVGKGLMTFDVREPRGFAIAGVDRKFHWAKAAIAGPDRIEVWCEDVPEPAAVRYAWADNPVCNVRSREGLPLTPFRTDDWPGITADVQK